MVVVKHSKLYRLAKIYWKYRYVTIFNFQYLIKIIFKIKCVIEFRIIKIIEQKCQKYFYKYNRNNIK